MTKFLLDTNTCIYFLKGKYNIASKIKKVGENNCFISEITVAELKFGIQKSNKIAENTLLVEAFISKFSVIPIFSALDVYAEEKARLSKTGNIIDDFDLLIGSTAIFNNMTLATNNTKHLARLKNIKLVDWVE